MNKLHPGDLAISKKKNVAAERVVVDPGDRRVTGFYSGTSIFKEGSVAIVVSIVDRAQPEDDRRHAAAYVVFPRGIGWSNSINWSPWLGPDGRPL